MERGADFSGWGSKQGSKIKTWKKRFFVLRGRELVYYSSSNNGGSDEKGRLTVIGADFAPDLKNGLLIRGEKKNKTQVLKMKTATADESKAWLLTIRQAVAEVDPVAPHISASFRTRSVSNLSSNSASSRASSGSIGNNNNSSGFFGATPSLPPVPERSYASQRSLSVSNDAAPVEYYRRGSSISSSPGDKRGWLLKEGRNVKSWKKRFFVLRGNVLTYYADEQSSPKLGSVVVHDVETNFTTPFTLDVHGAGGRLLRIAADSLDVIESWDLALAHAISAASADDSEDAKVRAKSLSTAASSSSSFSMDTYDAFEQHGKVQYRLDHQASSSLDDAYETAATAAVADTESTPYFDQYEAASASPQPQPSGPVEACEGWLLKQGRQSKQWKRRFFTLTHDSLEYRHAPDDFPNEDERILDAELAALGDLAVLYIELDSGRTITLTAESPSELARWVDALSAVLGKALSLDNQLQDKQEQEEQPLTPRAPVVAEPLSPVSHETADTATAAAPVSVAVVAAAPVAAPVHPTIKYGWLLKQGSLIKSWKRRYFVLEGDVLTYYEHIDKAPRGSGVVARVVRDSGDERGLDVHLTSGRILKVASETASDLEAWFTALTHAAQLVSQSAPQSSSSSATADTDAAHYVPTTLGQSGWLLKCGQNFKTWKLRYFVLERSRLLYYSSDDVANSDALGSGVVFDVSVGDARPLCINVRFQNGRLLQLAAPDEKLFTIWLRALETSSNLTESFLSHHEATGAGRSSATAFDDEFDLDVAEDGEGESASATAAPESKREEIVFDWERPRKSSSSSGNQGDNDNEDPKSGYAAWEAAMENKPEFDHSASWSSSDDEDDAQSSRSATGNQTDVVAPTSVAVTAPPLVAGWLNKEGGKVLKTWKRRYFSLHGVTLRSFKSESGPLLRTFTLAHVDECLALPLGLEVTTTTNRKLVLTAESKDDYARWLRGFQAALKVATSTPASPVATASVESASPSAKSKPPTAPSTPVAAATAHAPVPAPSTPVTAAPPAPVAAPSTPVAPSIPAAVDLGRVSTVNAEGKTVTAYSGWLEKEGQRFKTWKRRYFTYKRGALLYFSEIGGVAHGHGIVTGVRVDASKAFTLSIQLENERVLRVSAASADDMDTWLRVLTADCPLLSPIAAVLTPSSPAASPAHKTPSAASAMALSEPASSPLAGRGAARERVSDRLDPSDYLANDTISNESFLRIQDEQFRRRGDSGAAAPPATGPFKGDLSFAARDADSSATASVDPAHKGSELDRAEKLKLAAERAESEEDLAYYRELLAEDEREREKREAEKAQVSGCAPCCVVM